MGTLHKNRGMFLETIINNTINFYSKNKIALFHKKNLDVTFSKINKLRLENARIIKKSTTDYYGLYKGLFIAFEAKSTRLPSLPLSNIKEHQLRYLNSIKMYGGISFVIIYFELYNEFILLDSSNLESIKNKKSISYDEAVKWGFNINLSYPGIIDFIPIIKKNNHKVISS